MRTLLKGGTVVNVFTGALEQENVLIENDKIIGVGIAPNTTKGERNKSLRARLRPV